MQDTRLQSLSQRILMTIEMPRSAVSRYLGHTPTFMEKVLRRWRSAEGSRQKTHRQNTTSSAIDASETRCMSHGYLPLTNGNLRWTSKKIWNQPSRVLSFANLVQRKHDKSYLKHRLQHVMYIMALSTLKIHCAWLSTNKNKSKALRNALAYDESTAVILTILFSFGYQHRGVPEFASNSFARTCRNFVSLQRRYKPNCPVLFITERALQLLERRCALLSVSIAPTYCHLQRQRFSEGSELYARVVSNRSMTAV